MDTFTIGKLVVLFALIIGGTFGGPFVLEMRRRKTAARNPRHADLLQLRQLISLKLHDALKIMDENVAVARHAVVDVVDAAVQNDWQRALCFQEAAHEAMRSGAHMVAVDHAIEVSACIGRIFKATDYSVEGQAEKK